MCVRLNIVQLSTRGSQPHRRSSAKDKMAAATKPWTLSGEKQELLIKSCFEGS
jgi:hypothetical protein